MDDVENIEFNANNDMINAQDIMCFCINCMNDVENIEFNSNNDMINARYYVFLR